MNINTALEVRTLQDSDRDDWTALWTDYLDFYGTSVPSDIFATYFDRLLGADPQKFQRTSCRNRR